MFPKKVHTDAHRQGCDGKYCEANHADAANRCVSLFRLSLARQFLVGFFRIHADTLSDLGSLVARLRTVTFGRHPFSIHLTVFSTAEIFVSVCLTKTKSRYDLMTK